MVNRRVRKTTRDPDSVERTLLFTDIVRSTEIQSKFIDEFGKYEGEKKFREEVQDRHDKLLEGFVGNKGEKVSTGGDSYFLAFRDARQAILCAVKFQESLIKDPIPILLRGRNLPTHLQVRIGMHTGTVTQVVRGGKRNLHGQDINIAHRILEHAEGEQILVSQETWKHAGRMEELTKREYSGYDLKGVEGKWTLVEVLWNDRKHKRPEHRWGTPDRRLLQRYLKEVWVGTFHLHLTTIDRKAVEGGREPAELDLAAVFTDLDVREAPEPGREKSGSASLRDLESSPERKDRLPVMAAISRLPNLVLLGDPGSGKSSVVSFLALCLAGAGLGDKNVNLRRLGKEWKLPKLIPVRILLRDYAARGLPKKKSLWQFFQDELAEVKRLDGGLSDCLPALEKTLGERGGAILLLDGVDEVPEAGERRVALKHAIEDFAREFEHCRILVTSRPYGYQDPEAHLSGFEVRTLMDFTPEQIRTFIDRWYDHVGKKDRALGPSNAGRYAAQLRHVVETHDRIAELARRPLLLTLMASLHRWREGGNLPEKRQLLYEESVNLLIDLWQRKKNLSYRRGRPVGKKQYDVFRELGIPQDKLREVLNLVAFKAHRDQPALTGTHDIPAGEFAGALYEASEDKGKAKNFQRVIHYITDRAGILIERVQGKIYTFPHRTFQEYLAACHLAGPDFPYELAELLRKHDERWREVSLLAAAKAASGSPVPIWTLLNVFCPHDWNSGNPVEEADWYAALRAAQALIETEQQDRAPERQLHLVRRVRDWLVQLLIHGALPVRDRAEAGRLLNHLPGGDPRIERDEWVEIEGGEFTMGITEEEIARLSKKYEWARERQKIGWYADERPRQVRVPSFRIARYPVTNGQYARFINADGYKPRGDRYWSPEGLKWKNKEKPAEPRYWDDPRFNDANQPAVGVSWYEAEAYCNWLTEHLQSAGEIGSEEKIRLPREAEWEYAARGEECRIWPWREDWDPSLANTNEGGIGRTTAVGIYPAGATPQGVFDMAGNVWEWCEDWYSEGSSKNLRGGSWDGNADDARCAFRSYDFPDRRGGFIGFRCVVVPQSSPKK